MSTRRDGGGVRIKKGPPALNPLNKVVLAGRKTGSVPRQKPVKMPHPKMTKDNITAPMPRVPKDTFFKKKNQTRRA